MNTNVRVSVVMPSFNHGRFIKEAIDSVLSQDYPYIDLLVMDGGSTDNTTDILRSYGDKLSFVSERDKGQSDAINRGLSRVQGDIVCWLNSDDLFAPTAISTIAKIFQDNPDVDFVYGNGWTIDEAGNMMGDSGVLPFDLWKLIHQRNFIQQPSCFFRKSLLGKIGLIDESLYYVMDWELWIRFSAYKGYFTKEFLSFNRTYDQNKTQSGHFKRLREIASVVRKYTNAKYPPILFNYFNEVCIHFMQSKRFPKLFMYPLYYLLDKGMRSEMSGRYPDGTIRSNFRFSVGNPQNKAELALSIAPLSMSVPSRLGKPSIVVTWHSSAGTNGRFTIIEDGRQQQFMLPFGERTSHGFVHFTCKANYAGYVMEDSSNHPRRKVIAYLMSAES